MDIRSEILKKLVEEKKINYVAMDTKRAVPVRRDGGREKDRCDADQ